MNEKESIGLLEEMVMLIVLNHDEINGAEVSRSYVEQFKKNISLPAVIAVLKRLEKKGFLESRMGEATKERGGKRKRLYRATNLGFRMVSDIQESRKSLWNGISFG